jgi:hypothetical protein
MPNTSSTCSANIANPPTESTPYINIFRTQNNAALAG